jgi:hypothetical protein
MEIKFQQVEFIARVPVEGTKTKDITGGCQELLIYLKQENLKTVLFMQKLQEFFLWQRN